MKLALKLLLLAAGLALFGWYVHRVGVREITAALAQLGWAAPLVLLPYLTVYFADTFGWRLSFPGKLPVGFLALMRVRWSGEAVNNVVPSAYVGGEAVKVYLLGQRGVTANLATTAAVVSKSAQTLAQLLYLAFASLVFLSIAPDQPGLRAGLVIVLAGGLATVAGLFWVQRRGLFTTLMQLCGRLKLRPGWLITRRESLLRVDETVSGFYRDHRRNFFASTAAYFAGWLLDVLEIYTVAHLLGQPITWAQALSVEAFTSVAKLMGMWIPGALGVQEGGLLLLGRAVGLPDQFCLAYALLRRAREVVFVGIGWLFLYAGHVRLGQLKANAEASP